MKKTRFILLGIIVLVITTLVGVYAANTFNSKDISYTNESTEVTNVQDAVDELYDKSLSEINALKSEKEELTSFRNNVTKSLKEIGMEIDYLADVVSVGDYVAYDAGEWTETIDKPTSQGQFGGYTSGQNKANSVACLNSTSFKGWRVFSMDTSTKTVTIIHAGHPECYCHTGPGNAEASLTNLNNRADTYLNSNYAESAHLMTLDEAQQEILRWNGTYYWLATGKLPSNLYDVQSGGDINDGYGNTLGIRPVVVLKPNILTTGKGTDMVGQEAWTLVKP